MGLLADVSDADSTRKVYLLAAGLAALGIALIVVTIWFWRNTRHDPQLLGPLEVMSSNGFRKLDGRARQQRLDDARPPDAEPMRWGVTHDVAESQREIVDLRAINRVAHTRGYDDLREDAPEAVVPVVGGSSGDAVDPEADAPVIDDDSTKNLPEVDLTSHEDVLAEDVLAEDVLQDVSVDGGAIGTEPSSTLTDPDDVPTGEHQAVGDRPLAEAPPETNISEADMLDLDNDTGPDVTGGDNSEVFAIADVEHPSTPRPEPVQLHIVPVDHDLGGESRRSAVPITTSSIRPAGPRSPRRVRETSVVEDQEPTTDDPAVEPTNSIDPLLRKFNSRNS